MDGTIQRLRQLEQEIVGLPYRFWYYGSDWEDVQCMVPPWDRPGYNCTSSQNRNLGIMRDEGYATAPVGGTTDYASALENWEPFNINKNYPPGVFLVAPYTSERYQGHLARVDTWEYEDHSQYMAQDDAGDGVSDDGYWGYPGFNFKRTMWETEQFSGFVWAGTLPGVPLLDGFPGTTARDDELIAWITSVWTWYGFPKNTRHYPLNTILTECSPVLSFTRGSGDLKDIPGYWNAVDHDSYGPFQQRAQYWPLPWNFECALLSFCQAVYKEHGTNLPVDKQGTALAIQAVQRSFDETGNNYAVNYASAQNMVDGVRDPDPDPEPVDKWTELDGIWVRGDHGHLWGYVNKETGKVEVYKW